MLTSEMFISDYFEQAAKNCKSPKLLANLLITDLLKSADLSSETFPISADNFCSIIDMMSDSVINSSTAKKVLKYYCETPGTCENQSDYVRNNNLGQINNKDELYEIVAHIIDNSPKVVNDFKSGRMLPQNHSWEW